MDDVLQLALVLSALAGEPGFRHDQVHAMPGAAAVVRPAPARASDVIVTGPSMMSGRTSPADPWLSEDKFRHAAASWAAMVFTYAVVRSINDDRDVALAAALPATAGLGIAKEVVDRHRGGQFSLRDLAADALGAGAAWLLLREVR